MLGSGAFIDRVRALVRGQSRRERREAPLLSGWPLEVVCSVYGVALQELSRRGSREPARAAFAYVARQRTTATHTELIKWLGVSRPESVPNLTNRYAASLPADVQVRAQLQRIDEELDRLGISEKL